MGGADAVHELDRVLLARAATIKRSQELAIKSVVRALRRQSARAVGMVFSAMRANYTMLWYNPRQMQQPTHSGDVGVGGGGGGMGGGGAAFLMRVLVRMLCDRRLRNCLHAMVTVTPPPLRCPSSYGTLFVLWAA